MREYAHGWLRSVAVMVFSIAILGGLFRLTTAGSLSPVSAPAASMNSIEENYNALVGTFDSSGIVADENGSALEISKCIIARLGGGGSCP